MAKRSTAKHTDTDRYHVPNLERALRIMEFLAGEAHGLGLSEIAEKLELPKNSVFRIVSTLHAHGYLNRDDANKFTLGSKLLTLGYAAVQEGHLVEKSFDIMRQIGEETGETTCLGILDDTEGVVLECVTSSQQVQVVVRVGTRFMLHTAAPGKAMMAHLPADELKSLLDKISYPKFTGTTITSKQGMRAELEKVLKQGYALDNAEHVEGVRCVGASILNQRAEPVGAVWITGPTFRITDDRFESLGKVLAAGAARISTRFGYGGE